jgi:hypothetical protein
MIRQLAKPAKYGQSTGQANSIWSVNWPSQLNMVSQLAKPTQYGQSTGQTN